MSHPQILSDRPWVQVTPSSLPSNRCARSVNVRAGVNPYRLVVCDMDGTLLNNQHSVSDRTRRVLSQLLARGVHVIFATGRPFTDVYRIKRRLNIFAVDQDIPTPGVQVLTPACKGVPRFSSQGSGISALSDSARSPVLDPLLMDSFSPVIPRCFAITSNGACVYNEANERVHERFIHPLLCKHLYALFKDDPEVNINIFRRVDECDRREVGYINPSDNSDDPAREEWISRYPSPKEAALYVHSQFTYKIIPDLEHSLRTDHVNEIFFLCYDPVKAREVEREISHRMEQLAASLKLESTVRVAPSAPYCLDIIPADVSKATALQYVVQELGLTMEDCIAFGDGLNDVEMLQSVGKACIMANANPRLMDLLPHIEVIGCNDEDGVAQKLMEVFDLE